VKYNAVGTSMIPNVRFQSGVFWHQCEHWAG